MVAEKRNYIGDQIRWKERSIIKPEGRSEASSSGAEIGLGGKYDFPKMLNAILENPPEATQVLLCAFKIQDEAKMYIALPDYVDFQFSELSSYMELSAIPKKNF